MVYKALSKEATWTLPSIFYIIAIKYKKPVFAAAFFGGRSASLFTSEACVSRTAPVATNGGPMALRDSQTLEQLHY